MTPIKLTHLREEYDPLPFNTIKPNAAAGWSRAVTIEQILKA